MKKRYKFGLVSLFGLFTLFGFCSSENTCYINDYISSSLISSGQVVSTTNGFNNVFDYGNNGAGTYCVKFTNLNSTYQFGFANTSNGTPSNLYKLYSDQAGNWICLYGNKQYFNINTYQGYTSSTINYEVFKFPDFLNTVIPCQSDYNTCQSDLSICQYNNSVCIHDRDQLAGMVEDLSSELNACQNSSSGGSCSTGDISWSALYINNIQHLSSPIIRVDIPEEINWDYSVENDTFNLDVEGYNVDSDYIEGIINLQKSTPNSQDFNDIITKVVPLLVPGLVIILFIIFIFRFIKKIF